MEEAKENIETRSLFMSICTFTHDEGVENCKTSDGKKIDYKQYRYKSDMILEELNKIDLYVDSYKSPLSAAICMAYAPNLLPPLIIFCVFPLVFVPSLI